MPPAAKRRKTTSASKAVEPAAASPNSTDTAQYPGFDPWNATMDIEAGDKPSIFNNTEDKFVHSAKIYDSNAFKLKPLTIADSPLKGRHVIMLEPIAEESEKPFRFLDLPAELRNNIFDMVFKEDKDIDIETFTSRYSSRRAVREGFLWHAKHLHMKWNAEDSNWDGQTPSAHSLLRVCKQINAEAAPIAYGSNQFGFDGLQELKAFLSSIGTMRRFLRHIALKWSKFHRTLATPAFHMLKDAKMLQTLSFGHQMIDDGCDSNPAYRSVEIQQLALNLKPMLKVLHKAQLSSEKPMNVSSIIRIAPESYYTICEDGEMGKDCKCNTFPARKKCRALLQHVEDVQTRLQKAIADTLGIEVASSKQA